MAPDSMQDVSQNMRRIGMLLFRDALMEALQGQKRLCVVHAAHAAEILLKARIAQEHPLLIFSKLPKADTKKDSLTLMDLLESGRTLSYEELPDQLWATTGIKIEKISQYREFGRLRNQIIHFSMSTSDCLDTTTVQYSLEFLDPLVESFWGRSVIDFIIRDPHDYYSSFVDCGLLEDSVKRVVKIDERLRRLLGDVSKNAWEAMQDHFEDQEVVNDSDQYWQASYENWLESRDPIIEEHDRQRNEQLSDWKKFLESF